MTPLSEADALAVYTVLVAHAGASPEGRDDFVYGQTSSPCEEWRFQGLLGFGGKFRRQRTWIGPELHDRWRVDCYPEDVTDARRQAIDACNEALAELQKNGVPQ